MTASVVAPSPTTTLVGGVLAGTGSLHAGITVDDVVAALERLRDSPSHWSPAPFTSDAELDDRVRQAGRPPERWSPPDASVVDAVATVLDEGWLRVALRPTGSEWATPAFRFQVDSFDSLRALQRIGRVDDWHVAGHVGMRAGRVAWSWPLRVTASSAALLDELRSSLRYDEHYRVEEVLPGDAVEIAVVEPSTVGFLERVVTAVAIVVDAAAFDPRPLLDEAPRRGLAGMILVPASALGFVDDLVRELAHDQPLDVAASLVRRDATVIASPELLSITSIRTWAGVVAERADPASGVGPQLRDLLRTRHFDHEQQGGEATISTVTAAIPEPELRELTTVVLHQAAAEPGGAPPTARGVPEMDAGAEPRRAPPTARGMPEIAPGDDVDVEQDARRLLARVTDAAKRVREDAFVAGQRHRLRVRIGTDAPPGVVAADTPFRSPVPGQDVVLSVVVSVRGQTAKPKRRTLKLPAHGDTDWTSPVPIDVPADALALAIEIVVLYEGRTVQSAVLTGPVVTPGASAPDESSLTLAVDADTPTSDLTSRSPAPSTILVSTGVRGEPVVLDLSVSGRLLPADRLEKASNEIRRILLDTFLSPPADLAGAAGPLTKLAVWGATLRKQLMRGTGSFHDDDPWVHVVSFGDALVPFELIYTHAMPDDDDEVPVCDPALAGSLECAPDCPERARPDRVCPFGFWATSKIVERRVHVDQRTRLTAPSQRKVAMISGAVAGMSTKADEEDATSSQRIADAIAAAVPKDRFRRVTTWKELAEAVRVGRPGVVVLVTHTVKPPNDDDLLAVKFELGGDVHAAHRIDDMFVNPGLREPGPVVVSLGCDTGDLDIGFADWVATLHAAGAEVVVSTLSPVPGKEVARFIERLFTLLPKQFDAEPPHRFGAVLTAVRRATVATGDVLALSVTASGDGDVELIGATGC